VTTDELVALLAWCGLALWVSALLSVITHKNRIAAILNAIMTLPFLIMPAIELLKWHSDPSAYVRQYGAAALRQLPVDAVTIGLASIALLGCALAYRGHRLWVIVPFLLNAASLMVLFYLAYFFHIQF
jgi:hypothetical protein